MDERRFYGLDALRGGMMMLGIVLHASMLYLANPPPAAPLPTDRNSGVGFDLVFEFIHSFRMPAFFVLAGFFAALLVEKRGLWPTYRNRAARVLAPFLLAVFTVLPLTLILFMDFMLRARYGADGLLPPADLLQAFRGEMAAKGVPVGRLPLAHIWFLYYLCLFYPLMPLLGFLLRRMRRMDERLQRWSASPVVPFVLALATAALLWPFRGGQVAEGFAYFRPHVPSLAYYGSFFALGFLLQTYRAPLLTMARYAPAFGMLALPLFALAHLASAADNAAHGLNGVLHAASVASNSLCTWMLIYFFIGTAQRFFDRDAPWVIYVSQSSYWVFLVHMPLVCLAGWWLLQFDLPSALKFVLVCAFTAVVSFLSFHYWVQRSWMSALLHGKRFDLDWPWLSRLEPEEVRARNAV